MTCGAAVLDRAMAVLVVVVQCEERDMAGAILDHMEVYFNVVAY